ncbi:MAG: YihY/virulence factor BrkB family protein [Chloroflexota bacterium]
MLTAVKRFINRHPLLHGLLTKLAKDNVGMLAGFVSWSLLTSLVPIVVGLVAISTFFLRNPGAQHAVVHNLRAATGGAISAAVIRNLVRGSTHHSGLLGVIGLIGIFWGGSNVGGSLSTAFQPIFEVSGRNLIKEKLIDVAMIFVFTALMLVILGATTAGAFIDQVVHHVPVPAGFGQFLVGTIISLFSAFLLFSLIYLVFPNANPRFKLIQVWRGALFSAVAFQILSYIWPIYANVAHFHRYGAVFFPLVVLGAWIYFFAMITMIGAELVAVPALLEANRKHTPIGPAPQNIVPQHEVLRSATEEESAATERKRHTG